MIQYEVVSPSAIKERTSCPMTNFPFTVNVVDIAGCIGVAGMILLGRVYVLTKSPFFKIRLSSDSLKIFKVSENEIVW